LQKKNDDTDDDDNSGRGKSYMEVAWALCVPSLDKLTVFHRCNDRHQTQSQFAGDQRGSAGEEGEVSHGVLGRGVGDGPIASAMALSKSRSGRGAEYTNEDTAFAKSFFEGPRAKMYPHVGDPSIMI